MGAVIAPLLALSLGATPLLLPADAGFDTVLVRPRDPFRDPVPPDGGEEIRLGYQLFTDTAKHAAPLTVNGVSCRNCHLNAGQKEGALPLVGVAAVYPQPNKRAGRPFSLEDRVIGCLLRSSDAANSPAKLGGGRHENAPAPLITADLKPVRALTAYLRWLSDGFPPGAAVPWRGKNEIAAAARLPLDKLDPKAGQALFEKTCVACHAIDGQGVPLGDFKPGPLWGPKSWNDGAGLARIYTMAGYLRLAMPYLAPGSLTDEEAQQLAAFLCSKPRPAFAEKGRDYLVEPLPPDAVYYPPRPSKKPAAPVKATP
jgi:thiosulfate dehydrogenase